MRTLIFIYLLSRLGFCNFCNNMVIHFPKPGEFRLKDDPMIRLRTCLQLQGFDGKKKYFWTVAAMVKVLLLFDRVVFVLLCLNRPRRVVELTASLPIATTGMLKMLYFYFEKNRVNYLYDTITSEFWDYRICGPELEKEATAVFKYTNRLTCVHFLVMSFNVALCLIFPVAAMPSEDDRILPNVVWAPFDLNPSPIYEISFTVLLVNGVMTFVGNVTYDFFYLYCVQHLIVQFMILKGLFRNITYGVMVGASDVERFNSDYFQKTVMGRLKICAEHHSKLLKYGKNIENYCSFMLVPQLVLTYASLVVNGFILTTDRGDVSQTITLFNLSINTFIQLLLFALSSSLLNAQYMYRIASSFADCLTYGVLMKANKPETGICLVGGLTIVIGYLHDTTASLSVLDSVYDSEWYLFNAPMKRAGTFIMMNGKKGISIKAGGTTKIDNPLLVDMMQKVFSAITLLRALVDTE